jgi:Cu-Zn family superoxide dismutase
MPALMAGCAAEPAPPGAQEERQPARPQTSIDLPAAGRATASIGAANRSDVEGAARFVDLDAGVRVVVLVDGLGPAADKFHGLQILAATSCDDLDDDTPHFDPDGAPHGPFDARRGARHAGDLGNIRAYEGAGRYDRVDPLVELEGPRSAVGRVIVIRAEPDDAWSRDGSAGVIVGCGVIEPAD